jgi:hypothetical protein
MANHGGARAMDDLDPTELSIDRLATVPAERDLPSGRLLLRKELLMAELLQTSTEDPVRGPEPSWSRRRRWVAFALIPAALIGAAATYALTRSPDRIVDGIGCYAEPRLDADTTVVSADGRDPVAICAGLWGNIGSGSAPPLVACVLPVGSAVGVFPSDDPGICAKLGADPLPAGYQEAAAKFASMRDDLIQRFGLIRCVSESEGYSLARDVLDAHGFTDWTVHIGVFSDVQPCAELAFESGPKRVDLVAATDPALGEALSMALDPLRCSGSDEAILQATQAALDQAGFPDWHVRIGTTRTSDQPCFVSSQYDTVHKEIVLGPGVVSDG